MTEFLVDPEPGRAYTKDGKDPRRFDAYLLLKSIPGMIERFDRRVPHAMFVQVDDWTVEVACPCGEQPRAPWNELVTCDCGRYFVYDGVDVRVANSPVDEPVSVLDVEPPEAPLASQE